MPTDAAFVIGTRHAAVADPCQDYARSGDGWVAVADGCSTGGHTDIGARLWVMAAKNVMDNHGVELLKTPKVFMEKVLDVGGQQMKHHPVVDGLATLAVGGLVDSSFHAILQGDGCVAVALCNGGLEYWEIAAPQNAPLYPQYMLDAQHLEQWKKMVFNAPTQVRMFRYDDGGTLQNIQTLELTDDLFFARQWSTDEAYAMLVCSDGVFSFSDKKPFAVLSDLFSVKEPTGAFMQRRLAAMQRGWIRKNEECSSDDLAVGGVWLPTM